MSEPSDPTWDFDMEKLFPDFAIIEPLASGAMSRVYHVVDRKTEEHFALKEAPMPLGQGSSMGARMEREWQVLRKLRHENIVRGYEVRLAERCVYVLMELVQGSSLQQLVGAQGPLPPATAADYIGQAARGLAAAHSAGVVHRDVKPSNLLCDGDGHIKVIDFGLAWIELYGQPSITLLHGDVLLGTVDYMSPEQATSCHDVDARTDIYALGCTLYFLLTGRAPFATGSIVTRLMRHKTERPESIHDLRPDVPASLIALCERMMEKSPEDRFASMAEVAAALEAWSKIDWEKGEWEKVEGGRTILSQRRSEQPPETSDVDLGQQRLEVQQLLACLDSSLKGAAPDRPFSAGLTVLLGTLRDRIDVLLHAEMKSTGRLA